MSNHDCVSGISTRLLILFHLGGDFSFGVQIDRTIGSNDTRPIEIRSGADVRVEPPVVGPQCFPRVAAQLRLRHRRLAIAGIHVFYPGPRRGQERLGDLAALSHNFLALAVAPRYAGVFVLGRLPVGVVPVIRPAEPAYDILSRDVLL